MCYYELLVDMSNGWIWFMCKYEVCVNVNYWCVLIRGEDGLWVNMKYVWIWLMCKYEIWWIWIMGKYDYGVGRHTDRQTHRHINTMTRPGLGAGQSENPPNKNVPKDPKIVLYKNVYIVPLIDLEHLIMIFFMMKYWFMGEFWIMGEILNYWWTILIPPTLLSHPTLPFLLAPLPLPSL